ncbi:tyrosyl-DNA phosphodiesterase I [Radiomyces spectabilis]|uniref:tyrosyl-DNA phosphodiesterase I n=1 Tax=Radiomyces spectabilis TaxID=64574 RepID=UPI00221FA563|nr:tyrosyl-DNA phosphodiesterase I [Radiomyces spectabilis]KAI8391482.1 tyrosyl-DNA phosphodiesterase I [Radiomyces spectabilis]
MSIVVTPVSCPVVTMIHGLMSLLSCAQVTLHDVVHHEDLEAMVQLNFTVDLSFLMSHVHPRVRNRIPITVIHGHKFPESIQAIKTAAKQWPNIRLISPFLSNRFGTHHTKAMLLFFNKNGTKTAQVAIMTANMCRGDWEDMTQGIYLSPRCPLKEDAPSPVPGTLINSDYGSPFERQLIEYLKTYSPSLMDICATLRLYDWSQCKVILIGSVPGYHREHQFAKWGLERLSRALRDYVQLPPECCRESTLIAQCSSMAKFTQQWFQKDFATKLSNAANASEARPPHLRCVYPSVRDVAQSHTGIISSAGFLRFEQEIYDQSREWFDSHLCRWQSEKAGRQKVMPHIKTYTRVYGPDNDPQIAWHLLTSANLSRAAWGEYQKNKTQLFIKSYELGVLICPSLWQTEEISEVCLVPSTVPNPHPASSSKEGPCLTVPIRLPYDLPLTPHEQPGQCYTRRYAQQAMERFGGIELE